MWLLMIINFSYKILTKNNRFVYIKQMYKWLRDACILAILKTSF